MSDPLTVYYASNPWEAVTATKRDYYEPLKKEFRKIRIIPSHGAAFC